MIPSRQKTTVTELEHAPPEDVLADVLDATQLSLAARLRQASEKYALAIERAEDYLERSMIVAVGIRKLMEVLDDKTMDNFIMPLMNTQMGFLTDQNPELRRDAKPYSRDTVRKCAVTALLQGFRLVGNEWAIIGGNFFGAKAGWRRKVFELPGVTDARVIPGVPVVEGKVARVRVAGSAVRFGELVELTNEKHEPGQTFNVQVRSEYDTVDTWRGKAERRAWQTLYYLLQSHNASADDPEVFTEAERQIAATVTPPERERVPGEEG